MLLLVYMSSIENHATHGEKSLKEYTLVTVYDLLRAVIELILLIYMQVFE